MKDREWLEETRSKLNVLRQRLSPDTRLTLEPRIARLEALLRTLEGEKSISKAEKDEVEKSYANLVSSIRVSTLGTRPTKPEDVMAKAKIVESARYMSDRQSTEGGLDAAERHLG